MNEDTLRKVVEDAFLLANDIMEGNDLDEGEISREFRTTELVIGLGERIARLSGFNKSEIQIPASLDELIDVR